MYKAYEGCEARVKVGEKHSEWFKDDQGMKQGCTLSLWLFNVFGYYCEGGKKGFHGGGEADINLLLFADERVSVADSEDSLQVNLKNLIRP